jgi:hypothetical protein
VKGGSHGTRQHRGGPVQPDRVAGGTVQVKGDAMGASSGRWFWKEFRFPSEVCEFLDSLAAWKEERAKITYNYREGKWTVFYPEGPEFQTKE